MGPRFSAFGFHEGAGRSPPHWRPRGATIVAIEMYADAATGDREFF
jgi:hypothetical protein